jgi:hypothetical protein
MEDFDSIRLVATQVAQGLFAQAIDPWYAGKILYAAQVAAMTISRPAPLKPSEEKPVISEPVSQAEPDLNGHFLGPDVPWQGNQKAFNPIWNYHKRLYVAECKRLGHPVPLTPEEMPAEGWLDQDDMNEYDPHRPEETNDRFCDQILNLRIDADHQGKLPPLLDRACSYGFADFCKGPWNLGEHHRPCKYCLLEREERIRLHPEEDVRVPSPSLNLQAVAEPVSQPRVTSGECLPDVKLVNTAKPLIPKGSHHRPTQGEGGSRPSQVCAMGLSPSRDISKLVTTA